MSSSGQSRVLGLDVARSLAILGMIVVHFSLVGASDRTTPGWMAEIFRRLDGRASALFMILAGIGVTLMTRGALERGDPAEMSRWRKVLVRRGLGLLLLGFLNLAAIWAGDILRVYGVSLLIASTLFRRSDRALLIGTVLFALSFIGLFLLMDFEQNWNWSTFEYRHLWTFTGQLRHLFYDGFRSVFPWTGFLLFGMWLGRRDLSRTATLLRVLAAGLVTGLVAEGVSALLVRRFTAAPGWFGTAEAVPFLLGTESMPALPLFLLATGGTAVAVIAGCCLVVSRWPGRLWTPLAATGQMALTWYIGHLVIGLGALVALVALGRTGTEPLPRAAGLGVAFFLIAVVCSTVWKGLGFRQGPLEFLLRRAAELGLGRESDSAKPPTANSGG